ncbi:MAG TPA: inositol monophosphatase family protein [Candidatus Saccharimonadales bacterium]|nr:inositol monophosphatase family protein [Candidatus Saccharimonadales bacterium]
MKSPYIPVALEAVSAAEALILKYYQSNLDVSTKPDNTPVTIVDQRAEEIIKDTIHAAFPDHTFYGEEGEKVDLKNHKGFTWIIDPIDGTKSYIRGIPLFGTLLALLHDGELIVGVSNAPAWGELLYAAKGEGAFFGGKPLKVSEIQDMSEAYLSNGRLKYFEDINKIPQLLKLGRQAKWARGMGDFWVYHLVAQGKVDIMIEGSVKFWDIAAAKVIVEEAGGTMTQLDGQPINYQSTTALATNGLLHAMTVAALNEE